MSQTNPLPRSASHHGNKYLTAILCAALAAAFFIGTVTHLFF